MMRKILVLLFIAAIGLTVTSCTKAPVADEGKLGVAVSLNALKEFTEAVGRDKVTVTTIIPDGTEPHDFEPKAQDLSILRDADIFVITGLGMELWSDNAVSASGNSDLIVVVASTGVTPITHSDVSDSTHQYDPHIWLGLTCAEIEVSNIKAALVKADPDNASFYEANAAEYITELHSLHADYFEKFKSVTNRSFVTSHAAFAYLCRDFDLVQNSVADVFAEGEPSARQLAELIKYCKANDVTTIFSEVLMSPEIAETLAREVGAQVKTIYTIASLENGGTYLERMAENLQVIYDSLKTTN